MGQRAARAVRAASIRTREASQAARAVRTASISPRKAFQDAAPGTTAPTASSSTAAPRQARAAARTVQAASTRTRAPTAMAAPAVQADLAEAAEVRAEHVLGHARGDVRHEDLRRPGDWPELNRSPWLLVQWETQADTRQPSATRWIENLCRERCAPLSLEPVALADLRLRGAHARGARSPRIPQGRHPGEHPRRHAWRREGSFSRVA